MKKFMKNMLVTFLAVGMMSGAAIAVNDNANDVTDEELQRLYEYENPVVFDENHPDTLREIAEIGARSATRPEQYYNLNQGQYNLDGSFKAALYTNYYFSPDADGELYVRADVDWGSNLTPARSAKIEVIERTSKKVVFEKSKTMEKDGDAYYRTVTVRKKVTGLNPNKFYYVRISKTKDSISADLSGRVKWPNK
ncbi:MAG: hypothetical protein ACI4PM_02975 [Butyricicoccus sp.]